MGAPTNPCEMQAVMCAKYCPKQFACVFIFGGTETEKMERTYRTQAGCSSAVSAAVGPAHTLHTGHGPIVKRNLDLPTPFTLFPNSSWS